MKTKYYNHPRHLGTNVELLLEDLLKNPMVEVSDGMTDKQLKNTKLVRRLQRGSTSHNLIYGVRSAFNDLECNYLLGMNEIIVKPFVSNAAKVLANFDFFVDNTKTSCKVSQEINMYYKPLLSKYKRKVLIDSTVEDLKYYSNKYRFPLDIKGQLTILDESYKEELKKLVEIQNNKEKTNG